MGNRCDHDKDALRLCDIVKRGKGGAPQVLGVISGYLNRAAHGAGLRTWHRMNPSGRGRRSEAREAAMAVLQFLTANWLQLDTRRCAMPGSDYLEAPDVKHIARRISESPAWIGKKPLSTGRVWDAIGSLTRAGYLKRSKQVREQAATGEWRAFPKITALTKHFFIELGGDNLWKSVKKAGAAKIQMMRARLVLASDTASDVNLRLAQYLNPGRILSPRQAHQHNKGAPPDRPHLTFDLAAALAE